MSNPTPQILAPSREGQPSVALHSGSRPDAASGFRGAPTPSQVTFNRKNMTPEEQQLLDQLFAQCHARNVDESWETGAVEWHKKNIYAVNKPVIPPNAAELEREKEAKLRALVDECYQAALIEMNAVRNSQKPRREKIAHEIAVTKDRYDAKYAEYMEKHAELVAIRRVLVKQEREVMRLDGEIRAACPALLKENTDNYSPDCNRHCYECKFGRPGHRLPANATPEVLEARRYLIAKEKRLMREDWLGRSDQPCLE